MKEEYYDKYYKDVELIDCMPTSLTRIGFLSREVNENKDLDALFLRIIVYLPDKNDLGWFGTATYSEGVAGAFISSDRSSWIICNQAFMADEVNHNTQWYPIQHNGKAHLCKGVRNIDGDVYAYGMVRSVFKRVGVREWGCITSEIENKNLYDDVEKSKETFVGGWVGFSALDGFNSMDIYAGGNKGDFWHYNGSNWTRKELPLNSDISSIACASTGQVYIGCRIGPVLAGRDDEWAIIDDAKQITHITWFKDRVYFVDKLGRIYTHNDGDMNLTEAVFKTPLPDHMRHLIKGVASCEECLVAYTEVQAYAYDGEIWHEIIEIPSLSKNK